MNVDTITCVSVQSFCSSIFSTNVIVDAGNCSGISQYSASMLSYESEQNVIMTQTHNKAMLI